MTLLENVRVSFASPLNIVHETKQRRRSFVAYASSIGLNDSIRSRMTGLLERHDEQKRYQPEPFAANGGLNSIGLVHVQMQSVRVETFSVAVWK